MRVYKANGGNIKEYYKKLRSERKKEKRILELDEKLIYREKETYNAIDPDIMIDMPYTSRTDVRWPKDMLRASSF